MSTEFVSFIGDSFSKYDDAVKVMLRIRPSIDNDDDLNHFEIVSGQQLNVKVPKSSWTYKNIKRHHIESSFSFEFSNIFDWLSTQQRIFSSLIDGIIFDFLSGKNGLLFTYGITNSGKTHTLIGKPDDPGILPRSIDYIFQCLSRYEIGTTPQFRKCPHHGVIELNHEEVITACEEKNRLLKSQISVHAQSDSSFVSSSWGNNRTKKIKARAKNNLKADQIIFNNDLLNERNEEQINLGVDVMNIPNGVKTTHFLYLSMAEIYNEQIFDLLDIPNEGAELKRTPLKIHGDNKSGFFVKNLKSILINDSHEAFKVLELGLSNRKIAETLMNWSSSRSHVIYTLNLIRCTELPNGVIATKSSDICFVDLAGAERQTSTMSEGMRLREASSINKSLLFLNRCIQEVRDCRTNAVQSHVSYRECKLTLLLQPFFIGRARMILLVNISPSVKTFDDTFSVLKFSSLTKEALDRPMGVELQQAIKVDAVLADPANCNLTECRKSELIEIIEALRLKHIDSMRHVEHYDLFLRDEMCKFAMDMLDETEQENENKLEKHRQLITESFQLKIEILNNKIAELYAQIEEEKNKFSMSYKTEYNKLKQIIGEKDNDIRQLLKDVDVYKSDSKTEIESLEDKLKISSGVIVSKNQEITDLTSQISILNNHISELGDKIRMHEIQVGDHQKIASQNTNLESELCKLKTELGESRLKNDKMHDILSDIKNLKIGLKNVCVDPARKHVEDYVLLVRKSLKSLVDKISLQRNELIGRDLCISDSDKIIADYKIINQDLRNNVKNYEKKILEISSRLNQFENDKNAKLKIFHDRIDGICVKINKIEELNNMQLVEINRLKAEIGDEKKKVIEAAERRKSLELSKNNYINEIKLLNSTIDGLNKSLDVAKSQDITKKNAKILDLESQLKGYKELNEEYRMTVKKLEDVITERKIMAPLKVTPISEPTKRPVSPSSKENLEGIFSKKNKPK